MRYRVLVALVGLVALVVVGSGIAAPDAHAALPGRAADCARVARRLGEVPGIEARIAAQTERLERKLASVTSTGRRARVAERLQARLERLDGLRARLAEQVARARERCPDA